MSGLNSTGADLINFVASRLELKPYDIRDFSEEMLRHFYLVKTNQFDSYKKIVDMPTVNVNSLFAIKPDHTQVDESLGYITAETRKFYVLNSELTEQQSKEYLKIHAVYSKSRQRTRQAIGRGIRLSDGLKGADLDALAYFWRSKWWNDHLERTSELSKLNPGFVAVDYAGQQPNIPPFSAGLITPIKTTVENLHDRVYQVVIDEAHQPDFVPFKAEVSTPYKPAAEEQPVQDKFIPGLGDCFTFSGSQTIHQSVNAGVRDREFPTALCENIMTGERALYYPEQEGISKANETELSLQLHVKRFARVAEEIERGNVSPDELATATMSILESFAGEVVDRHKEQTRSGFTHALLDIADERNRQIEKGYSYHSDDEYLPEILLQMGISYAVSAISNHIGHKQRSLGTARRFWPFNHHSNFQTGKWFGRVQTGSTEQRTRLVKACALIMAEIEKMDRKESK